MLLTRNLVIFGAIVIGCVQARPADGDAKAETLSSNNDVRLDGYNFDFETSNGIKRTETGVVKPGTGKDDGSIDVNGSFSYVLQDNTPVSVTFVASENGYRPVVVIGQPRTGKR